MDPDLPDSLAAFADLLQDLIDELLRTGQTQRAIQCSQAQSTLRTAASIIAGIDLQNEFHSQKAVDAENTLSAATQTLNDNANRIAAQEKNVSAAVGLAAGAVEVANAISPFNLAAVVQGLTDIRGVAKQ
jgi:hypothetical protein